MKIILCGACGKMGKMVAELAKERGVEVVCGVDLAPQQADFPVYTSFKNIRENADAVVDFSSALNLDERLAFAKEKNVPVVLASTGYSESDLLLIEQYSQTVPLFKTGNLSLGINVLQMLAGKAAKILEGFDVEIIERHHNQKKDAPSGTALMLYNSVNDALEEQKNAVYGRHGMVGARSKNEIGIHAIRGGTIVGEHEVMFAGEDEIITLSHSARSRKVFASGALKAAEWLCNQRPGLYDMNDLLSDLIDF